MLLIWSYDFAKGNIVAPIGSKIKMKLGTVGYLIGGQEARFFFLMVLIFSILKISTQWYVSCFIKKLLTNICLKSGQDQVFWQGCCVSLKTHWHTHTKTHDSMCQFDTKKHKNTFRIKSWKLHDITLSSIFKSFFHHFIEISV